MFAHLNSEMERQVLGYIVLAQERKGFNYKHYNSGFFFPTVQANEANNPMDLLQSIHKSSRHQQQESNRILTAQFQLPAATANACYTSQFF